MNHSWPDGKNRIQDICSRIVRLSPLKSFPDGYIGGSYEGDITIPRGTDISMFRQDEFTVVAVDSVRLYFRSNSEAKYILYSAKRGQTKIPSPQSLDLEEIISEFERDLDTTLSIINDECQGLSETEMEDVKAFCSRLLGYHDIF